MLASSLILAVVGAQAAPLPALVGTLSVTGGKVRLERAGAAPRMAGSYVRLRLGDRLTVVESPRATIRFDASRDIWRLPERGSYEVRANALRMISGSAPLLVRRGFSPARTANRPPRPMAGVVRGDDMAVQPQGASLELPINLSWTRAPGATRANIQVSSSSGTRLWQGQTAATQLTLPAEATPAGEWTLVQISQSGGGRAVAGSAWIRLVDQDERKILEERESDLRSRLADDSVTLGLALGDLWASSGLLSKLPAALAMAFPSDKEAPLESPGWHWQHGEWLEVAGFPALAREAYQRAWGAGERSDDLRQAISRTGGSVP